MGKQKVSRNINDPEGAVHDWNDFCTFCKTERYSGGPDHHMTTTATIARGLFPDDEDWKQRSWLTACYAGPYTAPGGLVLWREFPSIYDVLSNPESVELWCKQNNDRMQPLIHRWRRVVKTGYGANLARYLLAAAEWTNGVERDADYEDLWTSMRKNIPGLGRYSGMKFLEASRRADGVSAAVPDVRAVDGQSKYVRWAISHMVPGQDEVINACTTGKASRESAPVVEQLAREMFGTLKVYASVETMYQVEVLLCNWRQSTWDHYFPGKALVSELKQIDALREKFPEHGDWITSMMLSTRKSLYPREFLPERTGEWSPS